MSFQHMKTRFHSPNLLRQEPYMHQGAFLYQNKTKLNKFLFAKDSFCLVVSIIGLHNLQRQNTDTCVH